MSTRQTVLCYGDSNTFGAKPLKDDFFEKPLVLSNQRYDWNIRWTGILQKELGPEYNIIEEGLGSRTTSIDDSIEGMHKNGLTYLLPCLESHCPIDLVVLMLGTNNLKKRFSLSAYDISMSIMPLLNIINTSHLGPNGDQPKILLMSPPTIGRLTILAEILEEGKEKSKKLAKYYMKIAKLYNCYFFNTDKIISTSDIDGVHFEEKEHRILGKNIAQLVKKILG